MCAPIPRRRHVHVVDVRCRAHEEGRANLLSPVVRPAPAIQYGRGVVGDVRDYVPRALDPECRGETFLVELVRGGDRLVRRDQERGDDDRCDGDEHNGAVPAGADESKQPRTEHPRRLEQTDAQEPHPMRSVVLQDKPDHRENKERDHDIVQIRCTRCDHRDRARDQNRRPCPRTPTRQGVSPSWRWGEILRFTPGEATSFPPQWAVRQGVLAQRDAHCRDENRRVELHLGDR